MHSTARQKVKYRTAPRQYHEHRQYHEQVRTSTMSVPRPHRERTSTAPRAYLDRTTSVPRPHHERTSTAPHRERTSGVPRSHLNHTAIAPRPNLDFTTTIPRPYHDRTGRVQAVRFINHSKSDTVYPCVVFCTLYWCWFDVGLISKD